MTPAAEIRQARVGSLSVIVASSPRSSRARWLVLASLGLLASACSSSTDAASSPSLLTASPTTSVAASTAGSTSTAAPTAATAVDRHDDDVGDLHDDVGTSTTPPTAPTTISPSPTSTTVPLTSTSRPAIVDVPVPTVRRGAHRAAVGRARFGAGAGADRCCQPGGGVAAVRRRHHRVHRPPQPRRGVARRRPRRRARLRPDVRHPRYGDGCARRLFLPLQPGQPHEGDHRDHGDAPR